MATASAPVPDTPSHSHSRRRPLIAGASALLVLLVVLAVGAAISWHFSSDVVVPDHSRQRPDATVKAASATQVALSRSGDTLRPGVYGLEWPGGHAIAGKILAAGPDQTLKEIEHELTERS